MKIDKEWFEFQEKICSYFKSMGVDARTNVTVKGIRTNHDVDILIETKFLGHEITWIVEAKHWKSKISKLHVLALRTITEDIGADKGFIISDKGFQKGAIEATKNTNIILKTFDELAIETRELIEYEILKTYESRINIIEKRYWSHDKLTRMKYGLRGERLEFEVNYAVQYVIGTAQRAISQALKKLYPISLNTHLLERHGNLEAENFQQLINWFNLNLNVVDTKILEAEILMLKNGDFNPTFI